MPDIRLTQEEADHVLVAVIAREDLLDNEIKKAAEKRNTKRIMEIAKVKEKLKSAEEKLCRAGATLPFQLTDSPPIKYEIKARSSKEATSSVMVREFIKEILDVRENIVWDKETVIRYWRICSDTIDEKSVTEEYLKYTPMR